MVYEISGKKCVKVTVGAASKAELDEVKEWDKLDSPAFVVVHVDYGTEEDRQLADTILAALKSAGIHTDTHNENIMNGEDIKLLNKYKSYAYELPAIEHRPGYSVSFAASTKDQAKAALTKLSEVLNEQEIKLYPAVSACKDRVSATYDRAAEKGGVGTTL